MQLNNTSGSVNTPNTSNKVNANPNSANKVNVNSTNTAAHKTSAQAIKTNSSSPVLPRSISSLISSCGLPADKLSASIISFARFFSLPLKPELMQEIRQQAFVNSSTQSEAVKQALAPATDAAETSAKAREAFSLAAAAAESKGVELQSKGLEAFAQAIDPDSRKDEGRGRRERDNKDDTDNEDEKAQKKISSISAGEIKKFALETAEKDALLSLLNKLPGKDGRRWIVLPFDFSENSKDFKVSLRILLEGEKAPSRAACLALDIAESAIADSDKKECITAESTAALNSVAENGEEESTVSKTNSVNERHWLFVLDAANGPADKLAIYINPELSKDTQAALVRDLSSLLEINPERITINHSAENFPCESSRGSDLLFSINEAV